MRIPTMATTWGPVIELGTVVRHAGETYRVRRLGLGETDLAGTGRRRRSVTIPGRPAEVVAPSEEWAEVVRFDPTTGAAAIRTGPVYGACDGDGREYPAGEWSLSSIPLLGGAPAPARVLISAWGVWSGYAMVHLRRYADASGTEHYPWPQGGYVTEMVPGAAWHWPPVAD